MARMPEGSLHFDQTYWPFLDGEEDLGRIAELYPEHMWTGIGSPPGPSVSGPEELAAGARAAARDGRSGRLSGCSAETCWRWASSTTAWTNS